MIIFYNYSFIISAGMAPAVVNCGDYPDVCEAFEVYQYPTVKYRYGMVKCIQ